LLLVPLVGPRKPEKFVVQEQQLIVGGGNYASRRARVVTTGPIVDFGNSGRVEQGYFAVNVPRRSASVSLAKQRIRSRKLFGNHLVAERWDNGDPKGFVAHQRL